MKLKRAYSPGEVLNMKIPRFESLRGLANLDRQPGQERRVDYLGSQRKR